MFTANEMEILMRDLKHIYVNNITNEFNFPSTVEIAIPKEYTTAFVKLLMMFDKKLSKDKADKNFNDELKNFLDVEYIEYD